MAGLRSVIFYFSQVVTGNTEKIARHVAKGLSKGSQLCDLVKLTKYQEDLRMFEEFPFQEYDLIGFGTPVYYFHPPYHLLFELKHLTSMEDKFGFLFCTSGGNPGSTLHQMKEALEHTGLKIIEGEDQWLGKDVHQMYRNQPNSNGHYGWLPSSEDHPNEDELKEAVKFGENLIKKALNPDVKEKEDFWDKENESAKMWSWEGIQEWFPEFELKSIECNRCGVCAQVCPWDAIVLDPYPQWTKDCDRCYICDLKCPQEAIQCDFSEQIAYLEGLMKKS